MCRGRADAPRRARAAGRSAARRNGLPGFRRLSARDARQSRPVCRGPASGRRDTEAAPPSLPVSCRNGYHGGGMSDSGTDKANWWQRLSGGLRRTSSSLGGALSDLVTKRKLDAAMIEELEEDTDPRRSRRRGCGAHRASRGRGPLRQGSLARRCEDDFRRRDRESSDAGRAAAGDRCREKTVRHSR